MQIANKVAQITLLFWVLKIVGTTLGETLGDFISITSSLGYGSGLIITLLFFLVALTIQLSVKKYYPPVFWLVIIATTTSGTEISDFIDRSLHAGYAAGSLLLITCLVSVLFAWYRKYKNLEVYPIAGKTKELFYWTAILISNSLGTAFGDFLSDNLNLSYIAGALITGIIILVVVSLHYLTRINHIALFWIAFIFTRPFGATFGDFLTKPHTKGGLDLGTLNASIVSVTVMLLLGAISYIKPRKRRLFNQQ